MSFERIGDRETVWRATSARCASSASATTTARRSTREVVAPPGRGRRSSPTTSEHVWLVRQPREASASRTCSRSRPASSTTTGEEPLRGRPARAGRGDRQAAPSAGSHPHGFLHEPGFTDERIHLFLATGLQRRRAPRASEDERIEIVPLAAGRPRRRDRRVPRRQDARRRCCWPAPTPDARQGGHAAARAVPRRSPSSARAAGAPSDAPARRDRMRPPLPRRTRRSRAPACSTSSPTSSSSAGCRATRSRPTAPTCCSSAPSSRAREADALTARRTATWRRSSPSSPRAATGAPPVGRDDAPAQGRLPALVLPPPAPRGADRARPDRRPAGPRKPQRLPQVLSRDEVARLLAQPKGTEPARAARPRAARADVRVRAARVRGGRARARRPRPRGGRAARARQGLQGAARAGRPPGARGAVRSTCAAAARSSSARAHEAHLFVNHRGGGAHAPGALQDRAAPRARRRARASG